MKYEPHKNCGEIVAFAEQGYELDTEECECDDGEIFLSVKLHGSERESLIVLDPGDILIRYPDGYTVLYEKEGEWHVIRG